MQTKDAPNTFELLKNLEEKDKDKDIVNTTAEEYLNHHKDENKADKNEKSVMEMTDRFYNLVTDFYEWGWGESFHFAPLQEGESKQLAFAKHEFYLALKLKLDPTDHVLDCGCGIGGPARSIARFADVAITGININEYQLERARTLTEKRKLQQHLVFKKENFNEMSFADGAFDKVYAIEATCHAVDVRNAYAEIYRVLKPGGQFACYEWCMTDNYDPASASHRQLKKDIIVGNGLSDVRTIPEVKEALEEVGFEILESRDINVRAQTPWYAVFNPDSDFHISTPTTRFLTEKTLTALELVKVVPKGSVTVSKTLNNAADALYAAGKEGIFTPMFFFLVQKPLK